MTRFPLRSLQLLLLGFALTAGQTAHAGTQDYAQQWPLQADAQNGAHLLTLPAEVYANTVRPDLRDIAAFNAADQEIPLAPWRDAAYTEQSWRPAEWLTIPASGKPGAVQPGDDLSLRLERDADGRLRKLDINTAAAGSNTQSGPPDLLLDTGNQAPDAIKLILAPEQQAPVQVEFDVLASDDLADWHTLAPRQRILLLDDNGLRIERLQVDLPLTRARYLRLHPTGAQAWPTLQGIELRHTAATLQQVPLQNLSLQAEPSTGANTQAGTFDYRSTGRYPITQFNVELGANQVSALEIQSRATADAPWRTVGGLTAFSLRQPGAEPATHSPQMLASNRDTYWRIVSRPALPQAPVLQLSYRPDRFLVLPQGDAPYILAAGSRRAERADYPIDGLLASGTIQRDAAMLPVASLGTLETAGGQRALTPAAADEINAGMRWQWVLWLVLVAGVALVVWITLRAMRTPQK
ncbi:MAG: DUF3999 family protein [Corticimicrobacter sp.]|uniref:DUF3999 family protein n=1 Tax=Corticimicrobacter sp. TaxID=2678536 RepID=UPI0032DBA0EE